MIHLSTMFWKINKTLLPLKFALFFWFGGAAVVQTFLFLYFKQKGLSLAQISIIGIITPIFQCIGPAISGIIADKTGRSKPVIYINFILVLIFMNSIILVPSITTNNSTTFQVPCNQRMPNISISPEDQPSMENCVLRCMDNHFVSPNRNMCIVYSAISCNIIVISDGVDKNLSCEETIPIEFTNNSLVSYFINDSLESSLINNSLEDYFLNNVLDSSLTDNSSGSSMIPNQCYLACRKRNHETHNDSNETFVFMLVLVLIICLHTTMCNIYGFMDVTLMFMVKQEGCDFGQQRLWSNVSLLILTPLAGMLIEATIPENGVANYTYAFYMFDVLALLAMLTFCKLQVQINPPAKDMCKKIISLLKNLDIFVFIVVVLILGTIFGFKENYTSLYLEELNAPSILISLVRTVIGVVGLPFLATSNWWIDKVGSPNLLLCALASYIVGFLGYSFLVDPWWCLMCEAMSIFTYHLLWVAVVRQSHEIAPEGLVATTITSAGSVHYILGTTTGSLIGGLVMSRYGGRQAYRVMAAICAVAAIFYGLFTHLRKRTKAAPQKTQKGYEMESQNCHQESHNL